MSEPKNSEFLLARNELLSLFKALKLLVYKEYNLVGDLTFGNRNEAFLLDTKVGAYLFNHTATTH